jgi:uncharacterized protein (DUF433 family)
MKLTKHTDGVGKYMKYKKSKDAGEIEHITDGGDCWCNPTIGKYAKGKKLIHSDKEILGGAPVLVGTRIQPSLIKNLLDDGYTKNDILEIYGYITEAHIDAAIDWMLKKNGKHR